MSEEKTRRLVISALFAAMECLAALFIRLPSPLGGYLNAGDALVLPMALLLGPAMGGLAAALGAAGADLLSGFAVYAPASFVLRVLMVSLAALLLRACRRRPPLGAILGGLCAEAVMVFGYFAYNALVLGYGTGALAAVPGDCMQGVFGLIAGTLLTGVLRRALEKRRPE